MTKRSYTSKPRQAPPAISFELDGVTFVAEGDLSPVDAMEFARLAGRGVDSESAEGAAAVGDILLFTLGESTYQAFRRHCREHRTDEETLMAIIGDLLTAFAERPTSRPSDSSDGPPTEPGTSTVVSFSRGTVTTGPAPTTTPNLEEPWQEPGAVVVYG
jgi:hypothetical protein